MQMCIGVCIHVIYRATITVTSTDFIKYQPLTTVVSRLAEVYKHCCALAKQFDRQKLKIATAAQTGDIITVDDDLHEDLRAFCCMILFHVKYALFQVNSIRK